MAMRLLLQRSNWVRYLFYQIMSVGSEQMSDTLKTLLPPRRVYFLSPALSSCH